MTAAAFAAVIERILADGKLASLLACVVGAARAGGLSDERIATQLERTSQALRDGAPFGGG